MNTDRIMANGQWANKIALRLQAYFDPFLLSQTNLNTDPIPSPDLQKVIERYDLAGDEIVCIYGLVRWRAKTRDERYAEKDRRADEIEMLYTLIQNGISNPDPYNFPISRICVELKDGTPYVIRDPINLINLTTHAWPYFKAFLEKEFHQYIKPQYVPRGQRKRKGADVGKDKACKELATQIIRYLDTRNPELQAKEKGDIVLSMFRIAGYNFKYKNGKNAYDSMKRATRNR